MLTPNRLSLAGTLQAFTPLRNNSAKEAGNGVYEHQILWEVEGNCWVNASILGAMGMRGPIRLRFLAVVLQDACSVAVWIGPAVGYRVTGIQP